MSDFVGHPFLNEMCSHFEKVIEKVKSDIALSVKYTIGEQLVCQNVPNGNTQLLYTLFGLWFKTIAIDTGNTTCDFETPNKMQIKEFPKRLQV